jgi:uncharacterized protein
MKYAVELLLQQSDHLKKELQSIFKRGLFGAIQWDKRLIGIKGARGTGKTTLLLQRLKELKLPATEAAYFSLDDLYFTGHNLKDTASLFYKRGGRYLFLDEVHKYAGWAREIKNLYDLYPHLKIAFTGSSVIDIARQEADLSRRVTMYELHGLSYREYLGLNKIQVPDLLDIETICSKKQGWKEMFNPSFKPLQHFAHYLKNGYYPFFIEEQEDVLNKIRQMTRLIVEYDMAELKDFDIRNAKKMLQLLYVISVNVPFKPNLTNLAEKSQIHRNSVNNYLYFLEQARLIRLLYPAGISVATLQKPEKIYLNNTSLAYALSENKPEKGNLRETFFLSQLSVSHKINYSSSGDFIVNDKYLFEVGGKTKSTKQIRHIKNSFRVLDDVDYSASPDTLPLWLFGFMY